MWPSTEHVNVGRNELAVEELLVVRIESATRVTNVELQALFLRVGGRHGVIRVIVLVVPQTSIVHYRLEGARQVVVRAGKSHGLDGTNDARRTLVALANLAQTKVFRPGALRA